MREKLEEIIVLLDSIKSGANSNFFGFIGCIFLLCILSKLDYIYEEAVRSNHRMELILQEIEKNKEEIININQLKSKSNGSGIREKD